MAALIIQGHIQGHIEVSFGYSPHLSFFRLRLGSYLSAQIFALVVLRVALINLKECL